MEDRWTEKDPLPIDASWSSAFGPPPGGQGVDGDIYAMIPYREALVVGGDFSHAGTRSVRNIAGWDGSTWTPLGSQFTGRVDCFCIHEADLVAGGRLLIGDDAEVGVVGLWNGSKWRLLGDEFEGEVRALAVFNGKLIAAVEPWRRSTEIVISLFRWRLVIERGGAGGKANCLWVWDGSRWSEFEGGLIGNVNHVLVRDGRVLVSGDLGTPDKMLGGKLLQWDGTEWTAWAWEEYDAPYRMIDHEGRLVVGGAFDHLGYNWGGASFVMKWTGERWQHLGDRPHLAVAALETHKGDLIVAGSFPRIGDRAIKYVARWDGARWQPLGSGIESEFFNAVRATASLGGDLYVGGSFHKAGGKPSASIGCWEG